MALPPKQFDATYEVTAAIQESSVKQYFWTVMVRPHRTGFVVVTLGVIAMVVGSYPYKAWIAGFFIGLYLILVASWVKGYFQIIAQARAGMKILEDPHVKITLNDAAVEYSSSTGTRRHGWDKIEKIVETQDFIVLLNGKLPLLSLPKSCFTSDALVYLRSKGQASPDLR